MPRPAAGARRPAARRATPRSPSGVPPREPLPLRHPALIVTALVAAAALVVSASYVLYDSDLWQHLVVGKAIWSLATIPSVNLWTWHHHGEPQITAAWLFRVLLWPLWEAAGVAGLYALRWFTTLAAFALAWATARALGARGVSALVVIAWCGLVYRLRTDIRPETIAAVLLALELWLLERRRADPGSETRQASLWDARWAIVPLLAVWANLHVSYWLGLLVLAVHAAEGWLVSASRRPSAAAGRARARRLGLIALAGVAAVFLHPMGWRALAAPFQFVLVWRDDPLFLTIGELHPLPWREHLRSGLPLLLVAWPLLLLARIRRGGLDVVEWAVAAFFTVTALSSQRFIGAYAVVAAPYVARGVAELTGSLRVPPWMARPAAGAALACAAIALMGLPEWTRRDLPLGVGLDPSSGPAGACDFIAAAGIRGRAFNHLHLGGYQAWRFWPERDRLPMVSTHPEDTPAELRGPYIRSFSDPAAWRALEREQGIDYVLLARIQDPGDRLLDALDADTTWALVFADDDAVVLVKRGGALDSVARRWAYPALPAGRERLDRAMDASAADPAWRARLRADLERSAASSPRHGFARFLLGALDRMEAAPRSDTVPPP